MATRDLTRRFAELRVLQHGVEGSGSENKRPGDAFSESGLLDVRQACICLSSRVVGKTQELPFDGITGAVFICLFCCPSPRSWVSSVRASSLVRV